MKVTIVYDNNTLKEGLREGWGFSCLVEAEENILFDTGWKGSDLLHNMKALGKEMKDVDAVVLSHEHWDHTGGLPCVLNNADDLRVYVPESFSNHLKGEIKKFSELIEVSGPQKITEHIRTTGELEGDYKGPIMEQSLVVETEKGFVALAGCSHCGVDKILSAAENIGETYGLVGGFHGFEEYEILKDLELIVPTHCTQHKLEIREKYPETTQEGGVGWTIEL